MVISHLTDRQIQEFISGALKITDEESLHIQNCEHCNNSVLFYRSLFSSLNNIGQAAPDPLLANKIMFQIEKTHRKPMLSFYNVVFLFGLAGFILIFSAVYKVYTRYNLTAGNLVLPLITIGICVTGFHVFDMFRSYKKKHIELFGE